MFTAQVLPTAKFLSTLSLRRATKACRTWTYERLISIHALLAESDGASSKYMSYGWDFYPRSPCGERRSAADLPRPVQDFYPRSPCGERQVLRYGVLTASLISIHALLAESDSGRPGTRQPYAISIHALLAESDYRAKTIATKISRFLSTLSLRRATLGAGKSCDVCGISIHALLAESDVKLLLQLTKVLLFLSTLSLRRATMTDGSICLDSKISIHALLAESDKPMPLIRFCPGTFLSTLSLRRATDQGASNPRERQISIHALLAESDCYSFRHSAQGWHFYPRSPCGERHQYQNCE